MAEQGEGKTTIKAISRSDVRKATIKGLKMVRSNPQHLRLTKGQRLHIEQMAQRSSPQG